jgi:Mrp family chromosome partitioning ATPase
VTPTTETTTPRRERKWLDAARNRWAWCVTILGAAVVAGVAFAAAVRPVFYTRSLVRVTALALANGADPNLNERKLRITAREMVQPNLLARTADRLGLDPRRNLRTRYLRDVAVRPNAERHLEIEVWAFSHDLAERWPEAAVQEYGAFRDETERRQRDEAIRTIARQIAEVRARIARPGGAEHQLNSSAGLRAAFGDLTQLRKLPAELAQTKARLETLDRTRTRLQVPGLDVTAKLAVFAALEEPGVRGDAELSLWKSLDEEQRATRAQLAELLKSEMPDETQVAVLNAALETLVQKSQSELRSVNRRFDAAYQQLVDQRYEIEGKMNPDQIPANKPKAADAGPSEWDSLFTKIEQQIAALDSKEPRAWLELQFDGIKARAAVAGDWVERLGRFLAALIAGALLAFFAPMLVERFQHPLSSLDRAVAALRIEGLGAVPSFHFQPDRPLASEREIAERAAVEASFRELCARLPAAGAGGVVLVASPIQGDGRTTVAAFLGIALGESGARVLVLDADSRHGEIHRHFGLRASPGLSDVLLGQAPLDQAIRPTRYENVFILPAGTPGDRVRPPFGSVEFSSSLETLRARFDRIVVDLPPLLGIADHLDSLRLHGNVMLLVLRAKSTPIRAARAAIESLRAVGIPIRGVVLNGIATRGAAAGQPRVPAVESVESAA